MKIKRNILTLALGFIFLMGIIFSSCQGFTDYLKNQFPELDTTTYVYIDGTLMAPVVNSTLTVNKLLKGKTNSNSNVWLETDQDSLIHVKARFDSIMTIGASDLGFNVTVPAGTTVGPFAFTFTSSNISIPIPEVPGNIKFKAPSLLLEFANGLVINYDFKIDSIVSFVNNQPDPYSTSIVVNIPKSDGQTPATVNYTVDTTNFPDLQTIFQTRPDFLNFVATIDVPSQQLSNDLNLSQYLKVDAVIDLPLIIYTKDFVLADTTDFNLDLPDQVKSALLKIVFDNAIPLGGTVYMAIVDSAYTDTIALITNPDFANSTDTLNIMVGTKPVVLKPVVDLLPAQTDLAGNPITPVKSLSKVYLSPTAITNLANYSGAKRLLIIARFDTYNSDNGQFVKILSDSYLNVKIGAKIEYAASSSN